MGLHFLFKVSENTTPMADVMDMDLSSETRAEDAQQPSRNRKDSVKMLINKSAEFIEKQRELRTYNFLKAVAHLCHMDTSLAESLWLDMFPKICSREMKGSVENSCFLNCWVYQEFLFVQDLSRKVLILTVNLGHLLLLQDRVVTHIPVNRTHCFFYHHLSGRVRSPSGISRKPLHVSMENDADSVHNAVNCSDEDSAIKLLNVSVEMGTDINSQHKCSGDTALHEVHFPTVRLHDVDNEDEDKSESDPDNDMDTVIQDESDSEVEIIMDEKELKLRSEVITVMDIRITAQEDYSDYIHANYVNGFQSPKKFIATQGPLRTTIGHFWQIIWEQNSFIIVMLADLKFFGQQICTPYWPENNNYLLVIDKLGLVTLIRVTRKSGYIKTLLEVFNTTVNEKRQIKHLKYTDWLDFNVPTDMDLFRDFILTVNRERQKILKETHDQLTPGPVILHCSTGVGRTGTFCGIDSALYQLVKSGTISVPETVLKIQRARHTTVITPRQYGFIYKRKPDSLSSIIQEYEEIVSAAEREACGEPNQTTEKKHEENCCLRLLGILGCGLKRNGRETILHASYIIGYDREQ
ncbi:hypothetical protein PR048_006901 [Dryococelus australis]|uniref:Protein tyrosine phosphatase n=1 Tax=Dryococelus australis TaxID=614101 RepID=A0ABQ9ICB6_9NEOP|nr:hypothetical protein PR048_006901 [Dryococelus australis]